MKDNKYLKLARAARDENNSEDAKKFYDMVRVEDPANGEAKFFYQYYSLYEGKNGELANRFINLANVLSSSVKMVAQSEDSCEDQIATIKAIVEAYTPMTWALNRYMNKLTVGTGQNKQRVLSYADIKSACTTGVVGLYDLGDAIAQYFANQPEAMPHAVTAWKEGISLQQKWYAYKYGGKQVEDYAAKIQKVDPTYVIPKKAGCITLADKK